MRFVGGSAHQRVFQFQLQVQHIQNFDRFGHNFGADAITGENCNFHGVNSRRSGPKNRSNKQGGRHPARGTARASGGLQGVGQPRLAGQARGLVGLDLVLVAQRQANVVQPVEQAVLAKRIDLERDFLAIGLDDDLAFQIHRKLVAGGDVDFVKTPNGKGFALVGADYNDPKYFGIGSGIAVRKGDKALLERINKALKQIRADGSYDKIQKKYFSFDIYGK